MASALSNYSAALAASLVLLTLLTLRSNRKAALFRPRLFSFGLITDIQYAPVEDGFSHDGVARYYSAALDGLQRAVDRFQEKEVDFVMSLGDVSGPWAVSLLPRRLLSCRIAGEAGLLSAAQPPHC